MNPLEHLARELLNAGMQVGSRALAKATDSALADVHRGVGRIAKEFDRRVTRARGRLEELLQELEESREQDDEWFVGGRR